jgi:hypothetical protein
MLLISRPFARNCATLSPQHGWQSSDGKHHLKRRCRLNATKVMGLLVITLSFTALASPSVYAQSEIDPDHFETTNTEPFSQPRAAGRLAAKLEKYRFSGKFKLPYAVQCPGTRLRPGEYSVSLSSDGKTGHATLIHNGQITEIAGSVRTRGQSRTHSALLVECSGNAHRLSAIRLAELDLVFDPGPPVEHTTNNKSKRIETLLLEVTAPKTR